MLAPLLAKAMSVEQLEAAGSDVFGKVSKAVVVAAMKIRDAIAPRSQVGMTGESLLC